MLALGALFLLWQWWRPIEVTPGDFSAGDDRETRVGH